MDDKDRIKDIRARKGIEYLEQCFKDGVFKMNIKQIKEYFKKEMEKKEVDIIYIFDVYSLAMEWHRIHSPTPK